MLLPNIIPLCLLYFQLIESHTPAGMRAIAAIHNQRARALANALNVRARAQYNAALARSRASNLGMDHRVIRDLIGQENENPELYGNSFEDVFIPQSNGERPQYSCGAQDELGDEINPEDLPQISVNFNENPIRECPQCQAALSQGEENRPQIYTDARSAEPHLHPHAHIHNVVHAIQPLYPSTTPGVNLHVVQNQNAAVTPQFASVQPGFNHPIHGLLHNKGVNVDINPGFIHPGHSTNVFQTQEVDTHNSGGHFVGGSGSSVVQTQNVHHGVRGAGGLGNMGVAKGDDKLGNFFSAPHMSAPQYEDYSDLSRPQNRQGIVRYLENEQILHNFKQQNRGDRYFENQRLGTFNIDPSQIEPIPALPENFVELDEERRKQSLLNILETERKNIKNIFDQIDQNQERNIKHFIDEDSHGSNPPRYQDLNQFDEPQTNFDIMQDVDVPERLGNAQLDEKWKQEDEHISQMLSKFIENDPDVQKKIGIPPQHDPTLGNLFQLPERRFSEDYLRLARSLNKTKMEELDKLLLKERKLINTLKKNAKHDEDLMMIGYIGDSLIDDFEKRIKKNRTKREIGKQTLPINRLITDPRTRLDVPKTLENLGAVTKTAFEHEKAPLYHVRNMMGSAQDAMMAAMKIPTKNFLIPSQYEIVNALGQNPSSWSPSGDQNPSDGIVDTFNKVGSAFRGSVLSGQEALSHVNEVANHAKSAVHSGRYAPRMILKQIPHITREPRKKAVIIAPRIFDIAQDDGTASTLGKSQPDFVRMGHIFDAVGLSNPNAKNVEFEKIIIEPNRLLTDPQNLEHFRPSKFLKTFKTMLKDLKVERANEEDFVGNALNTLDDVRYTVGANSLRDLILKMKQSIGTTPTLKQDVRLKRNQEKSKLQNTLSATPNQVNNNAEPTLGARSSRAVDNQVELDNLGASLFPQELVHPFMGRISNPETSQHQVDKHLGHILGAINPMMFERMFNESLTIKNGTESPHEMFHHHHEGRSHGHHDVDDELGTSMAITGQMIKPFMGQASQKMQHDFFGKYTPDVDDSPQFVEFESVSGVQEWGDILHPFQDNGLEYDDRD